MLFMDNYTKFKKDICTVYILLLYPNNKHSITIMGIGGSPWGEEAIFVLNSITYHLHD